MSGMLQMLIGRKLTPEEQMKKWRQSLRAQERVIDKQIRDITTEEVKVQRTLKQAAKKNDVTTCKVLAKELIRSRRAKERMHTSKAQLNSLGLQLSQMMATTKIAGSMQKSTEVMKVVNRLVKLPEISQTMMEMSQEMMKAGIIEEMVQDAIELGDEDGVEEEAEEEVEKILYELTDGQAGAVGAPLQKEAQQKQTEDEEMQKKLQALKALS